MEKNNLLISVVIASYNRCDRLKNTLDSILMQDCNGNINYEVIVVDNNSKDKTKDLVEGYKLNFQGKLRYLFESQQGKFYALNKGVKDAKGEIVVFTDDDCVVDKNWFKEIIGIFRNKKIDLLAGRVIPFFNHKIPDWLENYKNSILKYPLMLYDLGDRYLENIEKRILAIGANMSFKRESYYKFGGFLSNGRSEDVGLCYRWHNLGAKIAYSPNVAVYHYTYPHRTSKNYFQKYYFQTGIDHSIIFQDKYISGRHFLGAPLWLYRELIINILKYFKSSLSLGKNIFLEELKIYFTIGIICGLNRFKLSFEKLR